MNIKKVGLTALAGSLVATSAFAGSLSLSGGAKMSYVTKSGTVVSGTAADNVASGISMDQEISATGSGELDNGFTVSLTHGLNGMSGAGTTAGSDSSSITLDMGDMGTLSYDDTDGHGGLASLEDKMPKAYEEANDGLGTSGNIATMAKMASGQGFAYSNNVGDIALSIQFSDSLGATTNRTDGGQDTTASSANSSSSIGLTYSMDAITVFGGVGTEGQADGKELDHTTLGATYAFGPATIGYQLNDEDDSAAGGTDYETEIYGISFMVNDSLSISYGEHTTDKSGSAVDQEAESVQASYSMGGMSINLKDSEMTGVNHSSTANHETTEILVTFAF